MTESHPTNGSRFGSLLDRITPGGDGAGGRLLATGSLLAVLSSAGGSVLAHGALPGRMRIHWTLGLGPYYGPEFAPTALVLAAFTALVAGVALGAYWFDARLRRVEAFAPLRPYYALAVVAILGILLVTQGVLVVANLP